VRIVTVEPGSGQDISARLIARDLSARLGQPVVIDNRGVTAIGIVARAANDGYTMLYYGPALWLGPLLRKSSDYDPVRDFAPVTLAVTSPNVLVVHPGVPVKSVKELIALAKAKPGELNYGSGSVGSNSHLAAELFKALAGVNIVRVSYKGAGPALNDVIAGQIQMIIPSASSAVSHVQSGKVRALGVTSAQPSAVFPGVPAVAASVPGYESSAMTGMFAPAGTPASVINRLNRDVVQSLATAEVKERLLGVGIEVVASSTRELTVAIKGEMVRMEKVIRGAGIRED
jgi:tripartite-type tricarboxylate transporter receptor subunit TctC